MDFPVFDSVFIYLRRKNVLSEIFKKVFSCFLKFFKKSVDKCYENEYNNFCSREIWLINKEIEAWLGGLCGIIAFAVRKEAFRVVAQFGRALRSGRRGRRFKSCRFDWNVRNPLIKGFLFVLFVNIS